MEFGNPDDISFSMKRLGGITEYMQCNVNVGKVIRFVVYLVLVLSLYISYFE